VPAETVLFWDLDGTLLTTARAGIFALESAVLEVAGTEVDLDSLVTAGLTDAEVAAAALVVAGVDATDELVERFLRAYERHLPDCLPRRRGQVLPGVREALDDLRGARGVTSYLLTGNTEAGARAKLAHYALDGYFAGGAFCIGPGTRAEIAQRARGLAAQGARLYVIGDTPSDIAAGAAIGARTIAVATGSHSEEDLWEHGPWLVVNRIPEPAQFRALLEVS
jgi:phosphoglycolate phosphatase-like HAD superfamily hydrolase